MIVEGAREHSCIQRRSHEYSPELYLALSVE